VPDRALRRVPTERAQLVHVTDAGGTDLFIVVGGVKIAKRGQPHTAQARRWIILEPGWEIRGGEHIEVWHHEPAMH
jgi:hypothetical protein